MNWSDLLIKYCVIFAFHNRKFDLSVSRGRNPGFDQDWDIVARTNLLLMNEIS